jgi:hypothetical protein
VRQTSIAVSSIEEGRSTAIVETRSFSLASTRP